MSSTNKTTNYNLSQFVGTDIPSILNDYNGDMQKIDTVVHNVSVASGDNASAIASLQSTVSGQTSQITQIDSNVTALGGRVLTTEGNITTLGNRVTTVEENVSDIEDVIPSGASSSNKVALSSELDSLNTNLSASIQNAQSAADNADSKATDNADSIDDIMATKASRLTITGSTFAAKFASALASLKAKVAFGNYSSLQQALVRLTLVLDGIPYKVSNCPNAGEYYEFIGFETESAAGFSTHIIECKITSVGSDTPSVSEIHRYKTKVLTTGITTTETTSTLDSVLVEAFNDATIVR